ncbi:hypothetical protein [Paenibacillus lutrae]|uniref:Uncharacterized protein n=1 Tax=Paenibacillus lutrae TaxID=2078573 RepID=A0A7X3FJ70_9BACL|nr:hypothetical protein [Paenibacillus lutrae]MVP00749.1 hypothetical protein [Paenibacillus lutrae]
MIKGKLVASIIITTIFMGSHAMASASSFTNKDTSNWDFPSKTGLEAAKVENKILFTNTDVQWSADQLAKLQDNRVDPQFIPSFTYQADQDDLRSKLMVTNMPGAKFTRKDAQYGIGEEIQLSVLKTSDLVKDKSYFFYTTWLNMFDSNPSVSLITQQRFAQPNGTMNDIPKTSDIISKVSLKEAATLDKKYERLYLPKDFDSAFRQYSKDTKETKVKSYSLIDSKTKLIEFKQEADKKLIFTPDSTEVQFAITFDKSKFITSTYINKIVEENNLKISQIYAAGLKNNKEELTISWFDTSLEPMSLLESNKPLSTSFTITEIEGTAKVGDLIKIWNHSTVDVIEIEDKNGDRPTGVHWLNNLYDPKK